MSLQRMIILGALMLVLLITTGLSAFGAYLGHTGLFDVRAELAKYVVSTVVGALVSSFSDRNGRGGTPTGNNHDRNNPAS